MRDERFPVCSWFSLVFVCSCENRTSQTYVFINPNELLRVSVCRFELFQYRLELLCCRPIFPFSQASLQKHLKGFIWILCSSSQPNHSPLREIPVHWGGALNPGSPHSQNGGEPPPACSCSPVGPRRYSQGGLCPGARTHASQYYTLFLPSVKIERKHEGHIRPWLINMQFQTGQGLVGKTTLCHRHRRNGHFCHICTFSHMYTCTWQCRQICRLASMDWACSGMCDQAGVWGIWSKLWPPRGIHDGALACWNIKEHSHHVGIYLLNYLLHESRIPSMGASPSMSSPYTQPSQYMAKQSHMLYFTQSFLDFIVKYHGSIKKKRLITY